MKIDTRKLVRRCLILPARTSNSAPSAHRHKLCGGATNSDQGRTAKTSDLWFLAIRPLYADDVGQRPWRGIGIIFVEAGLPTSDAEHRNAATLQRQARLRPSLK